MSEPKITLPRGRSSNYTGPTAQTVKAQPIRCYLLSHQTDGLFLAFGTDAVDAARTLNGKLGLDPADVDRWSVSGSWTAEGGQVLDVSRWWPHFTSWPGARHTGDRKGVEGKGDE